jgi:hypothetical protein
VAEPCTNPIDNLGEEQKNGDPQPTMWAVADRQNRSFVLSQGSLRMVKR